MEQAEGKQHFPVKRVVRVLSILNIATGVVKDASRVTPIVCFLEGSVASLLKSFTPLGEIISAHVVFGWIPCVLKLSSSIPEEKSSSRGTPESAG